MSETTQISKVFVCQYTAKIEFHGCQHFSLWCECPHTASAKSFCYGILERLPNNYGDKSIQKVSSGVILVKGF